MSHVAKIEIEMKDLEAMKLACKRLGGTFKKQSTYEWFGRSVGDYPLPDGFAAEDLGKCEYAMRFPGASYEIGLVPRRDGRPGYTLLWDHWQSGGLERVLGAKAGKLVQAYGIEAAKRAARRAGHTVTESKRADGSVVLQVRGGR